MSCHDCSGARVVPEDVPGGYRACPLEATATLVCFDTEDNTTPPA